MSSLLLAAMSPMLREALLDSTCSCGAGGATWGGGASAECPSSSSLSSSYSSADPAAVVLVDERWGLSVHDLELFFGLVFGEKRFKGKTDLGALKRVCLALQVRHFFAGINSSNNLTVSTALLLQRKQEQQAATE